MDLLDIIFLFFGRLVWWVLKKSRIAKSDISYEWSIVLGFCFCCLLIFLWIFLLIFFYG